LVADALPLDTIAARVEVELEVQRSRFLTTVAPVDDEAAADAVVAELRRAHHDASHHCTALVLGLDGQRQRSNDDREPAGTAGAPMLAVLRGAELSDVVAVVTRWFGGTLLGAGGLVRAYGGAVTAALDEATRLQRRTAVVCEVAVDHATIGRLDHQLRTVLPTLGGALVGIAYDGAGGTARLRLPPEHVDELRSTLAAAGTADDLAVVGEELVATPRR
jgi:uncharacterized YigZ family protein